MELTVHDDQYTRAHTHKYIYIIEAWNPIVGMDARPPTPVATTISFGFQESHSTTVGDRLYVDPPPSPRSNRNNSKATSRDDVPRRPYHDP